MAGVGEQGAAKGGLTYAFWVLMFFFLLLCLFETGLLLGWAGFLLMLQGEGAYSELCANTTGTCKEADIQLNLIYNVGYFLMAAAALPSGLLVDRFSPRVIVPVAVFCCALGFVLIAVAASADAAWALLFPAFAFISLSGQLPQLAAFQFTEIAPQWKGALMGLLSGGLGVSSLVPLLLKEIWTAGGGHGALPAVAFSYGLFLFVMFLFSLTIPVAGPRSADAKCHYAWKRGFYLEDAGVDARLDTGSNTPVTLRSILLTMDFLAFSFYFVTRAHFCGFYLGAVNLHLRGIDLARADELTTVFGWVAPWGVLAGPFAGWWVESHSRGPNRGVVDIGIFTTGLHLLMAMVAWSEVWDIQVVAFVCYTVSQELVFASMFAWIGARFGFTHFGTLVGILLLVMAVASTVSNPIVASAASTPNGFRFAFFVFGIITVVAFVALSLLARNNDTVRHAGDSETSQTEKHSADGAELDSAPAANTVSLGI